ncbi:MAG: T9SS type A sorting domain-containing protein [Bacteroidota bacterium]
MKIKFTFLLFLVWGFNYSVQAQQLITENFDYTATSPLTTNNWVQILTSTVLPVSVTNAGLSFSGYNLSAIGNGAKIDTTGQDVYRDLFANTNSGSLYTSFMLNVSKATNAGDYFFAYLPQNSTSLFTGRLFIKAAGTGYYRIGISKSTDLAVYSTDSFATNTTSLLVVKYQFTTGTANDSILVYNIPSAFPSTEPTTATVATIGGATADAAALGRLALRQGTAASAPRLNMDGIRTANTWADLNASASNNPPSVFTTAFNSITTTTTNITWSKNSNYVDSTMTTLVFVKPVTAITVGSPNLSADYYTANANFSLASSFYQNDAAARCIYKGDTNNVATSGLTQNTLYQVAIFVVRNLDSAYATVTLGSFTTQSTAPRAITALTFGNNGRETATITWAKPTGYSNTNHTMVVYVKAASAITAGIPTTNPTLITADSNFGNGSPLSLDSGAYCIYKGDSTTLRIAGLTAGTNYYLVAYAINNVDSNYSPVINAQGITASAGPANVKSVTFLSFTPYTCRLSWTKDSTYNNANYSTLVFLKKGSAINSGSPSRDPLYYSPDSTFGAGTPYQIDPGAFCVYNGDSNVITPVNLVPSSTYYAVIYVVNNSDSLYSNPSNVTGITKAVPPENIIGVTVTGLTTTSAKIEWTKPSSYTNATYTTLVFVKANAGITAGIPTKTVTYYNAFSNFAFTFSTRYQNDTNAKCVYKGDTNFVNITSISHSNNYHVLIYVVRDIDSSYSILSATGSGTSSPPPPHYTISKINAINSITGVPDSLNTLVELSGIVYGVNQRTNGLQFVLRDNTGGITVSNTANNFGYTPSEGDSILVQGMVSSNRGLLIINTLDTLKLLASGKSINNPVLESKLDENTENNLVRLNRVKFLTTQTDTIWRANSTYPIITLAGDTTNIRIYATSNLVGALKPTTNFFHVIGLGTQQSNLNSPYAFTGYQILPRGTSDIITFTALSNFKLLSPANNTTIPIQGDTNQTVFISWTKSINSPLLATATYTWVLDSTGGNFTNPILSIPSTTAGADTSLTLTYGQIRALLVSLGVQKGQTKSFIWKVNAASGLFSKSSDSVFTANFTLGNMLGVKNVSAAPLLTFPNPFNENISIVLPNSILNNNIEVSIMDITGKVYLNQSFENNTLNQIQVNTSTLNKGIYLLKVSNEHTTYIQKMIKE